MKKINRLFGLILGFLLMQSGLDWHWAGKLPVSSAATEQAPVIRVLVVYTTAARVAAGGKTQMENRIQAAMDLMNQSFTNSQVNARVLLAGTAEVDYGETLEMDLGAALGALQNPTDGQMDEVHALRDLHYADLVNLVTSQGDRVSDGFPMTALDPGFATYAFSVTRLNDMLSDLGFLQALGKNLGAHEDWYTTGNIGPFAYSHGVANWQEGWRTIMARNTLCTEKGVNCVHIPYWSNPQVTYNGQPTGYPESAGTNCWPGVFSDAPCAANNAATINQTAPVATNFRQGAPPSEIEPVLLVNDEANPLAPLGSVEPYFLTALDSLNVEYDVANTGDSGMDEPELAELSPYKTVIWFTGDDRTDATGPKAGEPALAGWLDQGGCLLISSQDYAQSQPTAFMREYLGVNAILQDAAHAVVTGAGTFTGLGGYALVAPPEYPSAGWNYSDVFQPVQGMMPAFTSSQGVAGLARLTPQYHTVYLGFSLEMLPAHADRVAVLERFFDYCQMDQTVYLPITNRP
jgi:hypothetical protein